MIALRWLSQHWYLPLLALFAFGAWIFWILRMTSRPTGILKRELAVIDAGEQTRLRSLEVGRDRANSEIDQQYRAANRELDEGQRAKADRLRRDPSARVRYLNRLSAKRRE